MSQLLRRLWRHLTPQRRRHFGFIGLTMLASAFAELVTLGAVLPFLAVLIAPERALNMPIVARMAGLLGVASGSEMVAPLTIAFILVALSSGLIRIFHLWISTNIAMAAGADLSSEIYRRTLYQPYPVHVARNSSEIVSANAKVNQVVFGVLQPSVVLVGSAVVLVAIMIGLIAIDPKVALIAAAGFGTSYGIITLRTRRQLRRNSQNIAREQTQVIKTVQEGLGGIRDILLDGTQPLYCEAYRRADLPLRAAQGNNLFISGSPRFAMESLGMVLIGGLAYTLSLSPGGVQKALPVLGALAVGAQRLLPALQQVFSAWASMAGNHASLSDTLALLDRPVAPELLLPPPAPMPFEKAIDFRNVGFRYGPDSPWVLDGLTLSIKKGARVGFVGSTGSGKTTALDLLMGLLTPTHGDLLVDGVPLEREKLRAWQQRIAHVPQAIYLADATIAENIAFGVRSEQIDLERVREAARQAQLAEFIESRPEGYSARVGERGVRLSGGQRQRVGIARALYKRADVLVFDEATSALDTTTEQSVMAAIEGLHSSLTIILIAHRLSTVAKCDRIFELDRGKIRASGTYAELLKNSPTFRTLASHG